MLLSQQSPVRPGRASSVCPTMVAACAGPPMHLFFLVRMHPGVSPAVYHKEIQFSSAGFFQIKQPVVEFGFLGSEQVPTHGVRFNQASRSRNQNKQRNTGLETPKKKPRATWDVLLVALKGS